ncbi:MAG: acylneuraminate cytidylyltransferase family protein [Patescibacteria group bacterium]|nr:acylneuraminate cytidylyltransferase family protein [Patescibacteria group bacterium]
MNFTQKVVAIIPARGGSKGVPKKNIRKVGGFPLIAYAIAVAKLSKYIDRIIVSTDNEEIAKVAKKYGAEVPFLRPAEFAKDSSTDREFILHTLNWLNENEGEVPEYLVQIRPTTPLREPALIDKAIEKIKKNKNATSLRSGYEMRESPYKLFGIENDFFTGLFPNDPRPEYYNLPRQNFSSVYQPDGYVDVIVSKHALNSPSLHGPKILSFITPNVGEIDNKEDFKFLEFNLEKRKWAIHEYLKRL